jgi:hypothetical protein
MKVSKLAGKTQTVNIKVPGEGDEPEESVAVVYMPGALTLRVSEQITEAVEQGLEANVAFHMLKPMLVSWDLQDEEGNELPVNEETLKDIPLNFLGMILQAIHADVRPDPPKPGNSGNSLQQTDEPESSLGGTSS